MCSIFATNHPPKHSCSSIHSCPHHLTWLKLYTYVIMWCVKPAGGRPYHFNKMKRREKNSITNYIVTRVSPRLCADDVQSIALTLLPHCELLNFIQPQQKKQSLGKGNGCHNVVVRLEKHQIVWTALHSQARACQIAHANWLDFLDFCGTHLRTFELRNVGLLATGLGVRANHVWKSLNSHRSSVTCVCTKVMAVLKIS